MKRSRGRGRRQQNPVNRSYDSNGPDVRVRGTASQVYEKYQALARDAMASGDRVMAENYSQHGEHYYRILLSFQPAPGEGDKEMPADTANGEAKDGAAETIQTDTNGNGATEPSGEPLVLVRDAGEDDDASDADEKPAKPSRRRGPLRRKKTASGDGADANGDAAEDIVADAGAETATQPNVEGVSDTAD